MPTIKLPYVPHKYQLELHTLAAEHRFGVVVCHRRFGKTIWAINTLIDAALRTKKKDARYCYIAPFYKQAKQIAWDYFRVFTKGLPDMQFNEAELKITFPNGAVIRLYGADNPDALRGIYLDGAVLDEVADMRPNTWGEVLRPALADRQGWAFFIGTPKGINVFYELYERAKTTVGWFSKMYRVTDTDVLPTNEVAQAKAEMTDTQYAQEFLCDFQASTDNTLIPVLLATASAAKSYHDQEVKGAVKAIGVDVARYGDDRSVFFCVQGLKAFEPEVFQGLNNVELAQKLIHRMRQFEPDHVRIDAGGGAGVIDYLRSQGENCTEVAFGQTPMSPYYQNARAEMWHGIKKWMDAGGQIPNNTTLISELASPTYRFNASNKMILESKDDMRARGLRSPDLADALALAVGYPLRASGINNVVNKSKGITSTRRGRR